MAAIVRGRVCVSAANATGLGRPCHLPGYMDPVLKAVACSFLTQYVTMFSFLSHSCRSGLRDPYCILKVDNETIARCVSCGAFLRNADCVC